MSDAGKKGEDLRSQSRGTNDLKEYIKLTHETMAALLWYKRFAQSVLDVDASEKADVQDMEP